MKKLTTMALIVSLCLGVSLFADEATKSHDKAPAKATTVRKAGSTPPASDTASQTSRPGAASASQKPDMAIKGAGVPQNSGAVADHPTGQTSGKRAHEAVTAPDAATGHPSGKRRHEAITATDQPKAGKGTGKPAAHTTKNIRDGAAKGQANE